jgi:hypothetical protein
LAAADGDRLLDLPMLLVRMGDKLDLYKAL